MVGICGVLGSGRFSADRLSSDVAHRNDEVGSSFEEGRVDLRTSFHPLLAGGSPAEAVDGDVLVWVWGDVYGFDDGDGHSPRGDQPGGSARYCARLYDRHGMEFVAGLNGDFALVIYDRAAGTVSFVTDRIGTRPVYYATPGDEFVFASNAQTLTRHPGVDPEFDPEFLYEYFHLRRVFGVKSPIRGVEEIQPGAVTTIDLADLEVQTTSYWRPSYDPVDKPFSYYLDRFVETFTDVLSEWTRDELRYGLLLSGGSDSRLVQAAIDRPLTSFHITDWMSREARVAQRAADVSGDEFHLLLRDDDYRERLLERAPPLSNFSGWFDQAYFTGFEEEIVDETDVLLSGLYADTLFAGAPLSRRGLSLGPIGNVTFPIHRRISSIDDYVATKTEGVVEPLPYFADSPSIADVLRRNIRWDGDEIVSHGVRYNSLEDLVMYGDYYPMGADTDAIFSRSLMQMRPYRTPFLDNRLIDLHQRIPVKYFVQRNIINRAIERLSPDLAELPHASTGVALKQPFVVDYVGRYVNAFRWKYLSHDEAPAPHLDHDPWPNRAALIRARPFVLDVLGERRSEMDALPFLDADGAFRTYREHAEGADRMHSLYSLVTFLEMPVVRRATRDESRPAGSPRSPADRSIPDEVVEQ